MTARPLLLALLLLAGCIGIETQSPAPVDQRTPGRWDALAPMLTARQEVAVAALGGHVWVIGGFGAGAEPVATVERYDPATNSWDTRPPLPVAVHHAAAVAVGIGVRFSHRPCASVHSHTASSGAQRRRPPV